jgi:hypothetical protein
VDKALCLGDSWMYFYGMCWGTIYITGASNRIREEIEFLNNITEEVL